MATKKKEKVETPLSVRPVANDDTTVTFQVGHVVPAEEFKDDQAEHEFEEKHSFELSSDEAAALADALPSVIQEARSHLALVGGDRSGLSEHSADGTVA